ncbi:MAG TPA: sigma-70 family RNA polymerase sigma factor [Puia sp.]
MPSETKNIESRLLQRMKRGEEAAFNALYDRYHGPLYRNVIRLVQTPAEAQDIIQEVFITLWERRAELDISSPVNGWLFTLSYHRAVNYLRKKLHDRSKAELIGQLTEDEAVIDERLIESRWRLVIEALEQLSPRKKQAFELCKLEGKSYEQAAREMGVSNHTLAEYLQDAMTFVREYVRRHPVFFQ